MSTNFCQRLMDSCSLHADRTAMRIVGDDRYTFSFGELKRGILSVAYRLQNENVAFGDRVALIGENHPFWAFAYLGTIYHGAIVVPIDPHGETETITNFIINSEAKVVFLSPHIVDRFKEISPKIPHDIKIVVWQPDEGQKAHDLKFDRFEDWLSTDFPQSFADQPPKPAGNDLAVLIYTSGTTGTPKGVPLDHGNIIAELDGVNRVINLTAKDRILSLLPLFHAYLQIANLWVATTYGVEAGYLKELTPDELSRAMKEFKPTILTTVPRLWYLFHKKIFDAVAAQSSIVKALFRAMLRTNGFMRDTLNINLGKRFFGKVHEGFGGSLNIAISAGSRFDSDVAIDFHRLGFTILQGYGLSETSGAATATYVDDNRVGSVGKPMLKAEIKIEEPDKEGVGEVLIRGEMVFKGYYKNPEATAEAFTDDGWFRSGDLGKLDSDGHLYIVGRKKDVIVLPNGKNVHPEDLEVNYLKTPLVAELAVLGVADESIGVKGAEKLIAVVLPDFDYLKQQKIANSYEAIRFALDNLGRELPEYQRVRDYIVRAEPLPRTATRKIKRFQLLQELKDGKFQGAEREEKPLELSETDNDLLASPAGKLVVKAIRTQRSEIETIHPSMNLELDLGLDSLARAEAFAGIEQALGAEFAAEEAANSLTVAEAIALAKRHFGNANVDGELQPGVNWNNLLITANAEDTPEIQPVLRQSTALKVIAFVLAKIVLLVCKIALGLEIRGVEKLKDLKKPFIICPNHQSYLDGFIVPCTYPWNIFKDIFHVGAGEYFGGFFGRMAARFTRVVPIDSETQLVKAMKAGAVGLRSSKILNIYPEGERAFDGELHPFKNGAAILASELDILIVPVALDGLWKVWARGSNKIRLSKVTINFGDPINVDQFANLEGDERYRATTEHLKETIQEMLQEIRH